MIDKGTLPHDDPVALARLYMQAGLALGHAGRPASQLALLQRAIATHPTPEALQAAFDVALATSDYAAARQSLDLMEAIAPAAPWLATAETKYRKLNLRPAVVEPLLAERAAPQLTPVPGRICYLLHNSLPISSGGYATRAQGLAAGLQDQGYEIIALTRPGFPMDTTGADPDTVALEDVIDEVRYRRLFKPDRKTTKGFNYLYASAKVLQQQFTELRPALVMAASNHLTALPAQIAARALGIPFIYEVRGFWEVTRASREPEFLNSPFYADLAELEGLAARRADHVFTLTTPMREELVSRGVPDGLITLLPNATHPDQFEPQPRDGALAARLGIPDGVPVIGYIGSFVQYEGLDDLARAAVTLQQRGVDFRLLLVGNENVSGTDKGPITAEIERIATEEGLGERLIMPGRIPHEEVAAHYSLIDIAPFPRKPQLVTEMVSPMKPLEAMAMEKAVVASSVRALAEMVQDGQTGLLFAKGDVTALADVLETLIRDPAHRRELGQAGRRWVEQERTWLHTAGRAALVFDRLGVGRASHPNQPQGQETPA